ncbi:hypothetical protein D3C72_1798530 [compost metagenome]
MQARDVGGAVVVAAGQPALVGRIVIGAEQGRARSRHLPVTLRQVVRVVAGAVEEQADPQQAAFVAVGAVLLSWRHVHPLSWLRHGSAKATC